jgi:hypothetical protein
MNEATLQAIAENVVKKAATDVLREAADEVRGRSSRKWALALVAALIIGTAVTLFIGARRTGRPAVPDDQRPGSPAPTPTTATPAPREPVLS